MEIYTTQDGQADRQHPPIALSRGEVVAYARKSTKEDGSAKSIADQHEVNAETAQEFGLPLTVEKQLSEKIGMSGDLFWDGYTGMGLIDETGVRRKTRPALSQIVKGVQDGSVKCVIVWSLDRLWRDVTLCHSLIDLLAAKGCLLYDRAGLVNLTTPEGRQSVLQNAVSAQHQREKARVDSERGWRKNREKGKRNVTANVLGFRNIPGKPCEVEHVPEEQELVRRIFRLYDVGESDAGPLSAMKIAKLFMAEKVILYCDPRRFTRMKGNEEIVYINQIEAILRDVRYQGQQRHCKILSSCPVFLCNGEPVVSPATFERIQKKINDKKRGGMRTRNRWNLGGLVRCGICAQSMYAGRTLLVIDGVEVAKKAWASHSHATWCWCTHKLPRIVIEWLDTYVEEMLTPLLLAELQESRSIGGEAALRDRSTAIRRELDENKTAFVELASRIGKLDDEIINQRSVSLRNSRGTLEGKLRELDKETAALVAQSEQLLNLKNLSGEQKRDAFQSALRWVAVIPFESRICSRETSFKWVPGNDAGRIVFLTTWGTIHTATIQCQRRSKIPHFGG